MPQSQPPVVASVAVGKVDYNDTLDNFFKEPSQSGIIADCMILNYYERDMHVYMASLTSQEPFDGAKVGFVRIGNDTLLWVCEWTVCRMEGKEPPPIPDPNPPPGWVLLDVQFTPAMAGLGPSGIDGIYRISGLYVYGCLNPQTSLIGDLAYPQAPWVKRGSLPRLVPISSLDPYLKHPQPGGSSGGGGGTGGGPGFVVDGGTNGQGQTPPNGFLTTG